MQFGDAFERPRRGRRRAARLRLERRTDPPRDVFGRAQNGAVDFVRPVCDLAIDRRRVGAEEIFSQLDAQVRRLGHLDAGLPELVRLLVEPGNLLVHVFEAMLRLVEPLAQLSKLLQRRVDFLELNRRDGWNSSSGKWGSLFHGANDTTFPSLASRFVSASMLDHEPRHALLSCRSPR